MAAFAILFPERCGVCGLPGRVLCTTCRQALVRLVPPLCERCGAPGPWPVRRCPECAGRRLAFTRARAAIVYDTRARSLVRTWKEHGRRRLAVESALLVGETVTRPDVEALVPVPSDPERLRERGRAAPRSLARALEDVWRLPVLDLLRRVRPLPRQRGLALPERRRNVRDSVAAVAPAPARLCLVDDVYTSGATVDACAAVLRREGARVVEVVTLARAVR